MGCTKDKLVLFFPPQSYENLSEIRGLLTVWHAFKLYQKKSKKVSKNRPAVRKGKNTPGRHLINSLSTTSLHPSGEREKG